MSVQSARAGVTAVADPTPIPKGIDAPISGKTPKSYQAAKPEVSVPGWPSFDEPLLTIDTEWALVKSADHIKPANSNYYFWVKTIGEGAGNGFTRNAKDTSYFKNDAMYNILDTWIHSGWGTIYPKDNKSWKEDEVALFECECAFKSLTLAQPRQS